MSYHKRLDKTECHWNVKPTTSEDLATPHTIITTSNINKDDQSNDASDFLPSSFLDAASLSQTDMSTVAPFSAPASQDSGAIDFSSGKKHDMNTTLDSSHQNRATDHSWLKEHFASISDNADNSNRLLHDPKEQPQEKYSVSPETSKRMEEAISAMYNSLMEGYKLPANPVFDSSEKRLAIKASRSVDGADDPSHTKRHTMIEPLIAEIVENTGVQKTSEAANIHGCVSQSSQVCTENTNAADLTIINAGINESFTPKLHVYPTVEIQNTNKDEHDGNGKDEGGQKMESTLKPLPLVNSMQKPDDNLSDSNFDKIGKKHIFTCTCICVEDSIAVQQGKRRKFTCGGCLSKFISVCLLHEHVKTHGSDGSYHFDHVSNTAYPKYDTFCSFTQTDLSMFDTADEVIEKSFTDCSEMNLEKSILANHSATDGNVLNESNDSVKNEGSDMNDISAFEENFENKKNKRKQPRPSKVQLADNENLKLKEKPRVFYVSRNEGKNVYVTTLHDDNSEHFEDKDLHDKTLETDCDDMIVVKTEVLSNDDTEDEVVKPIKKRKAVDKIKPIKKRKTVDNTLVVGKKKRGRPRKKKIEEQIQVEKEEKQNEEEIQHTTNVQIEKERKQIEEEIQHTTNVKLGFNDDTETEEKVTEEKIRVPKKRGRKPGKIKVEKRVAGASIKQPKPKRKPKEVELKQCDVCRVFIPQSKIAQHMMIHTGERPYTCEVCGKSFTKPRSLVKHQIVHAEIKPWKCSLCEAQFCQKPEYQTHMAGHADYRPYECKVCEMRFLNKTTMLTHQANIHMGITKFECELCAKRFFKKSSLTVHKATHFEATMKCTFCDRMFRDKTGLKRHERIHTGVKKFQCHICDHGFIQSTPFWIHMEKRHGMDRSTLKTKLKEVHEQNRRSGIKTEVSVLPRSADETNVLQRSSDECTAQPLSTEDTDKYFVKVQKDVISKEDQHHHVIDDEFRDTNEDSVHESTSVAATKMYTDIKVPKISGNKNLSGTLNDDSASVYDHGAIVFVTNIEHNAEPQQEMYSGFVYDPRTSSQPSPQGQGLQIQHLGVPGMNMPLGLIGHNSLQVPDCSILPTSGTYTDISTDKVKSE